MSKKRKSIPHRSVPSRKRVAPNLQTELINGCMYFKLNIERCNSLPLYKTCANRMDIVLNQAFPSACLLQNPNGTPRNGAFEIEVIYNDNSKILYSKLDTHGPDKDHDVLPDPLDFITKTLSNHLSNLSPKNNNTSNHPPKEEISNDIIDESPLLLLDNKNYIDNEQENKDDDEEEFVSPPPDIEILDKDSLEIKTVFQLRKLLANRRLPTYGRKSVLIGRLLSYNGDLE